MMTASIPLLANTAEFTLGRSSHIFLSRPSAYQTPENIEFLLQIRSGGHYAVSQLREAPFGGMEERGTIDKPIQETSFETLVRELKEEILGKRYADHLKDPIKYPFNPTAEEKNILAIIDRNIQSQDDLILVHRGIHSPPNQGWDATVDSFFILKKDLKVWEYDTIKAFVNQRNHEEGLENAGAGGEVARYVTPTVGQILDHVQEGANGTRRIFSMVPEDYAFQKTMHQFIHKYLRQPLIVRSYRAVKNFLCRRDTSELRPYKLKYTGQTAIRKINGVDTICRILDTNDQPAFVSHGVVSHSRGLRFMQVADKDSSLQDRDGNPLAIKAGEVFATVMDFDQYGILKPILSENGFPDVYIPTNDAKAKYTSANLGTDFERIDIHKLHGAESATGLSTNGLYVRKEGGDFFCLPEAVEVPTIIGDNVFMPGDSIILRPQGAIEGMAAHVLETAVIGLPRHVHNLYNPLASAKVTARIKSAMKLAA